MKGELKKMDYIQEPIHCRKISFFIMSLFKEGRLYGNV